MKGVEVERVWYGEGMETSGHVYIDFGRGRPWLLFQVDFQEWRVGLNFSVSARFVTLSILCFSMTGGLTSNE